VFQRKPEQTDSSLRAEIHESLGFKGIERQKRAQLFGQPVREFGCFAQLRKQKKAPRTEILYIQVNIWQTLPDGSKHLSGQTWRSINNASNNDLTDCIKCIAAGLEEGKIFAADAEFLLDTIYHEIGRRV
jgi:hypothetical protein